MLRLRIASASKAFGALRRAVFDDLLPQRNMCMELVCCLCCFMVVSAGCPLRNI